MPMLALSTRAISNKPRMLIEEITDTLPATSPATSISAMPLAENLSVRTDPLLVSKSVPGGTEPSAGDKIASKQPTSRIAIVDVNEGVELPALSPPGIARSQIIFLK